MFAAQGNGDESDRHPHHSSGGLRVGAGVKSVPCGVIGG